MNASVAPPRFAAIARDIVQAHLAMDLRLPTTAWIESSSAADSKGATPVASLARAAWMVLLALTAWIGLQGFARAQGSPGSNDPTFNVVDDGTNRDGANYAVLALALQPDGKLLIGGDFTSYNGTPRNLIARLNADGSLDASFNPGSGANFEVHALALQSDGKVLIGGTFTSYNGTPRNRIARLNADGSLDASFNPGSGANSSVYALALQPDGKLLIGGDFTSYNGTPRNRIARLNADGSLDASFNPGTGADTSVRALALQPDGKLLIGGEFISYNGTPRNRIARLNADGSLDASFNPGTGANGWVLALALQPDGKLLIGGEFTTYNGTPSNRIARLNAEGSLDASFNPGSGANFEFHALALQPDGKLLIGGTFTSYNGTSRNGIARLNADGSLDASFNPGTGANGLVLALALKPDGKLLIGGEFISYNGITRNRIARLNADGSLDASFNPGTGANSWVLALALQPDGKLLIAGYFTNYNDTPRNGIARLNADGSLDASFNPGTGANGLVLALALQPDGKVLIGGTFTSYNGTPRNRIARLNADGSLDASFNPGTGANSWVWALALQPDGKLLIGGDFINYAFTPSNRIARLNADGSFDASFYPGTGANNSVVSLALQPDGKVLIGGTFTSFNGTPRYCIARLNADGSLDASFNPGTGSDTSVLALALQPDGKLLIGGGFTAYNGTPRNHIARLNADGSLDASFNPGTGANSSVSSLALQPDGKVLIGGVFTTYNGTPRNRIARLNANGSLDASFNPGTGANSTVRGLALQPDGKLLIGGGFTAYNGTPRTRLARLHAYEPYSTYCDGPTLACPCGNFGSAGNGCANSVNAAGAHLAASGVASLANDTLLLAASGTPNSNALYFQGTTQSASAFGDGVRCAAGTIIRLGAKASIAGSSNYPGTGEQPVSVRGAVPAGAVRHYQVWYRNAAAFCTPSTFNLTNGVSVNWAP
jgi:uncharacterized delta-60 repeat protein